MPASERKPSRKPKDEEPVPPVPKLLFPSFAPATPVKKRTVLAKPAEIQSRVAKATLASPARILKSSAQGTPREVTNLSNEVLVRSAAHSRSNSEAVLEDSTNRSHTRTPSPPSPLKIVFPASTGWPSSLALNQPQRQRLRSTDEKKEFLGNWLGNVDALVEGVQKAGVWGLG